LPSIDAICSFGSDFETRNPCIGSQRSRCSMRAVSSVSTPSATTFSRSECASAIIVETSVMLSGLSSIVDTKARSIFSTCTGSLAK
jgi:hypothetical protein